jgi:hypothetical protein
LPVEHEGFGRCACGGTYEKRFVEVRREGVVLTDVARGSCDTCGSYVYSADTLERIETLLFLPGRPDPAATRWAQPTG